MSRGCGARFVHTARAQKRWCETLGLAPGGRSARCPACLGRWLREHGVERRLADAARALSEAPLHAPAVLAYARAAVEHAARSGGAPLGAALAAIALLSAHGAAPDDSLYWAGRCHAAAGRPARAAAAFRRFIAATASRSDLAPLRRDARARMARGTPAVTTDTPLSSRRAAAARRRDNSRPGGQR